MAGTQEIAALLDGMTQGSERCLSRLMTLVENGSPQAAAVMAFIAPRIRGIKTLGITGAPGVGKSSLINRLVPVLRRKGLSVGVLAVDPSSPFHGGAILGDRIRMNRDVFDGGVFFRSIAARGASGGLPRFIPEAISLLDAFGMDLVLVETVGIGQTNFEIMHVVDCVCLVLSPDAGDGIQFMKSGIMEVADLLIVNKVHQPADLVMVKELERAIALRTCFPRRRKPTVLGTNLETDDDMVRLIEALGETGIYLEKR